METKTVHTLEIGGVNLILQDKDAVRLAQGASNSGKVLMVGPDGNIALGEVSSGTGSSAPTPLKGKKYCAVGDSITFGVGASETAKRWADLVVKKLALDSSNYQNLGVSTTTITASNTSDNSICNRILGSNIASDCDLITLMGGVNDFNQSKALGSLSEALEYHETNGFWDTTNFCGAYCAIIDYVHSKRPNAQLVVLTPMHYQEEYNPNDNGKTLLDYVQAIRDICEHFAVYVVDCYKDLPIDCKNSEQRKIYTSNGVVPDGIHPSDKGHELIANLLCNRLLYHYIY